MVRAPTWNPTRSWSMQASYGVLDEPERLEPGVDIDRTTVSSTYHSARARGWYTTFAQPPRLEAAGRANRRLPARVERRARGRRRVVRSRGERREGQLFAEGDPLHGAVFKVGGSASARRPRCAPCGTATSPVPESSTTSTSRRGRSTATTAAIPARGSSTRAGPCSELYWGARIPVRPAKDVDRAAREPGGPAWPTAPEPKPPHTRVARGRGGYSRRRARGHAAARAGARIARIERGPGTSPTAAPRGPPSSTGC